MKHRLSAVRLWVVGFVLIAALGAAGCTSIRTRVWMNEGHKLYKAQKYEQAIVEYKKIVAIDPDNWPANYQIAMSYLAMYHPGSTHEKDIEYADNSVAGFERLLALQAPDKETEEKVRNYYVALLRSTDKMDKIVTYYDGLLEKDPRNTTYIAQLAEIYAKKGDFPSAMKYYTLRAEIEPKNKEAWYTIGVLSSARAKEFGPILPMEEVDQTIDEGIKAMDKALAIDPNYFEALVWEGILYRQKSSQLASQMKNEEAGEAFTRAEELKKKAEEIIKKQKAADQVQKGA